MSRLAFALPATCALTWVAYGGEWRASGRMVVHDLYSVRGLPPAALAFPLGTLCRMTR